MRLVHQQHKVGQSGQVFEVALAQVLRQRLIRGDRPPRTSVLILEMLKMLTLQRMSRSKSVPARDCQLSPVMISGGWFAKARSP